MKNQIQIMQIKLPDLKMIEENGNHLIILDRLD